MNAQSRRVLLLENECSIQIGKMSSLVCFLKGTNIGRGQPQKLVSLELRCANYPELPESRELFLLC